MRETRAHARTKTSKKGACISSIWHLTDECPIYNSSFLLPPFLPFLPFFFFFLVGGVGIGGGGFIFGAKASRQVPSAGEASSGVCGAALEHSPASPPGQGKAQGEG